MTALDVVIAARGGAAAKGRLASVLAAAERRALVAAMLGDMLVALRSPDLRLWVVTPTDELAELATSLGAQALRQMRDDGLNGAFAQALAEVRRPRPLAAVALLPGDLPLLTHVDLDLLGSAVATSDLALARAANDGGTNGVCLAPGTGFEPQFGPNSLQRHLGQARQQGQPCRVIDSPTLGRDLDRADDIAPMLMHSCGARTLAVLARNGLAPQGSTTFNRTVTTPHATS